jgi:hypothetical protein
MKARKVLDEMLPVRHNDDDDALNTINQVHSDALDAPLQAVARKIYDQMIEDGVFEIANDIVNMGMPEGESGSQELSDTLMVAVTYVVNVACKEKYRQFWGTVPEEQHEKLRKLIMRETLAGLT